MWLSVEEFNASALHVIISEMGFTAAISYLYPIKPLVFLTSLPFTLDILIPLFLLLYTFELFSLCGLDGHR